MRRAHAAQAGRGDDTTRPALDGAREVHTPLRFLGTFVHDEQMCHVVEPRIWLTHHAAFCTSGHRASSEARAASTFAVAGRRSAAHVVALADGDTP